MSWCLFVKNILRIFQARFRENVKNIEPGRKFHHSYKKKRVFTKQFITIYMFSNDSFMPGSDGRQESLARRYFHSFSPLIAVTRWENE